LTFETSSQKPSFTLVHSICLMGQIFIQGGMNKEISSNR
jgi:hypothetical protein